MKNGLAFWFIFHKNSIDHRNTSSSSPLSSPSGSCRIGVRSTNPSGSISSVDPDRTEKRSKYNLCIYSIQWIPLGDLNMLSSFIMCGPFVGKQIVFTWFKPVCQLCLCSLDLNHCNLRSLCHLLAPLSWIKTVWNLSCMTRILFWGID